MLWIICLRQEGRKRKEHFAETLRGNNRFFPICTLLFGGRMKTEGGDLRAKKRACCEEERGEWDMERTKKQWRGRWEYYGQRKRTLKNNSFPFRAHPKLFPSFWSTMHTWLYPTSRQACETCWAGITTLVLDHPRLREDAKSQTQCSRSRMDLHGVSAYSTHVGTAVGRAWARGSAGPITSLGDEQSCCWKKRNPLSPVFLLSTHSTNVSCRPRMSLP